MDTAVVRLERVSKRYNLTYGWYPSLRDALGHRFRSYFRPSSGNHNREFWALKDISLDIGGGEWVGVIGRNGAGKSTILKLISRVTVPTSGEVQVRGVVGALIEVGAGFHPELTGRENVYLNGSIMGMSRREIEAKFDSIVGYAGLGDFINTPIKYYSSGMQVRLGFAVAAHIDPDVLLIDEVLAVGDAAFQVKCLDTLTEFRERGKTIVLVSHNMGNILQHTGKAIWLEQGTVQGYGPPEEVVDRYLASTRVETPALDDAPPDRPLRIVQVDILNSSGIPSTRFDSGETCRIRISYACSAITRNPVVGLTIRDARGYAIGSVTVPVPLESSPVTSVKGSVTLTLEPLLLSKGAYVLDVYARDPETKRFHDFHKRIAAFVVEGRDIASRDLTGYVSFPHHWKVEQ